MFPYKFIFKVIGKLLFVLGLILNLCMVIFGWWPNFLFLILMAIGGILIITNKNAIHPHIDIINYLKQTKNKIISILEIVALQISFWYKKLLVLLLAFIILLVIATLLFLTFGRDYFKERRTIQESHEIVKALNNHYSIYGKYPNSLEIIVSNNPLKKDWFKDSWENKYKYLTKNHQNDFLLISPGKDFTFNTNDDLVFNKDSN